MLFSMEGAPAKEKIALSLIRDGETTIKITFSLLRGGEGLGRREENRPKTLFFVGKATRQ